MLSIVDIVYICTLTALFLTVLSEVDLTVVLDLAPVAAILSLAYYTTVGDITRQVQLTLLALAIAVTLHGAKRLVKVEKSRVEEFDHACS